jgi:hypothetical protein
MPQTRVSPFLRRSSLLTAAALAMTPGLTHADRRYYGETYTAVTAPPGGLDVELWSTLHRAPRSGGALQFWRHQLELETGITSRWDVAVYNIWDRVQGDSLRYQATKLETRYRLSDYGQWIVDPVVYFEARKEWIEDKPLALEGKLILGKDVGSLNVSVNALYEIEFIPAGGGREHELGYAVGASYELTPWVRLGGEAFGSWTRSAEAGAWASQHYAGPALSLAVSRTWLVLAAGFGLTDESQRAQLRAVLAFQF